MRDQVFADSERCRSGLNEVHSGLLVDAA